MKEIHYGTKNQIIVNNKANKKRYYIFLKDESEKQKFGIFVDTLQSSNISIKEYTKGEKTYLGEKLNYKQIQDLKKKKKSH